MKVKDAERLGKPSNVAKEIVSNCLMARTRYLSRVVTGIYDDEVRAHGLQASQITLLAVVAAMQPVRRSDIGRMLHYDSSTLTRNLKVLLANAWVVEVPDEADRRSKLLEIGAEGRDLLEALAPAWRRAQKKAEKVLGLDGRETVMTLFSRIYEGSQA